jgi:hypothetical protein
MMFYLSLNALLSSCLAFPDGFNLYFWFSNLWCRFDWAQFGIIGAVTLIGVSQFYCEQLSSLRVYTGINSAATICWACVNKKGIEANTLQNDLF